VLGVVGRRRLRRSPVVTVVARRVAADLSILDPAWAPRGFLSWLDPRAPARRVAASWRVGRLRRAMPLLAADMLARVDAELSSVPALTELDDRHLLRLLGRTSVALRAVHGHEVLAGALLPVVPGDAPGAAAAGLAALADGRRRGLDDETLLLRHPEVLALTAPRVGSSPLLPASPATEVPPAGSLGAREALRLRARWLQELSGRAAWVLGTRLAATGRLAEAAQVRWLSLSELTVVVDGAPLPSDLAERAAVPETAPLPSAFRLSARGEVVAEVPLSGLAGRGAGGGRGVGRVGEGPGCVLVVRTLEPGLAATLPGLAGLVSETGSVLSHLAILARELGVPTVVGVPDAVMRFPTGSTVLVDGGTGEVAPAGP
jgi:rifampicin phosphotransferase